VGSGIRVHGLYFKVKGVGFKPRLRVTRDAEALARGQLARASFLEIETSVSIPVKQPKLFQVLLSFPWSTRARGLSRSARVSKKFSSFADWLKNGGVLRGSGRGGLRFTFYVLQFSFTVSVSGLGYKSQGSGFRAQG
jgi:hypothetical protein